MRKHMPLNVKVAAYNMLLDLLDSMESGATRTYEPMEVSGVGTTVCWNDRVAVTVRISVLLNAFTVDEIRSGLCPPEWLRLVVRVAVCDPEIVGRYVKHCEQVGSDGFRLSSCCADGFVFDVATAVSMNASPFSGIFGRYIGQLKLVENSLFRLSCCSTDVCVVDVVNFRDAFNCVSEVVVLDKIRRLVEQDRRIALASVLHHRLGAASGLRVLAPELIEAVAALM